jgi:hypothetical protein
MVRGRLSGDLGERMPAFGFSQREEVNTRVGAFFSGSGGRRITGPATSERLGFNGRKNG